MYNSGSMPTNGSGIANNINVSKDVCNLTYIFILCHIITFVTVVFKGLPVVRVCKCGRETEVGWEAEADRLPEQECQQPRHHPQLTGDLLAARPAGHSCSGNQTTELGQAGSTPGPQHLGPPRSYSTLRPRTRPRPGVGLPAALLSSQPGYCSLQSGPLHHHSCSASQFQ